MCNCVEVLRLRNILVSTLHQRDVLQTVFTSQMKMMEKDGQVNFNDHFNFASLMASSPGWKNFVDDGPE
jgi:hypothetical protein